MSLRAGLIGLGEVAQLMHLPLIADDPRWRITGVSDLSAELTEAMGARYGAELRTTDAMGLIRDERIDVVFILSPDETHAPLLEAAMAAGKPVFVEKPAALTAELLRPLVDRERTAPVFVGYMRRYSRPFLSMKERLAELGPVRHVRVRDLITEAPFFTAQTRRATRGRDLTPETGEALRRQGAEIVASVLPDASPSEARAYRTLTGLGCHSLSAMRDLFGRPRRVLSAVERGNGLTVSVQLDYGDFLASYEACGTDVPLFDSGIDAIGQHARMSLNYDTPYIRHLPTRLEIVSQDDGAARTEIVGPFHEDPFRIELDAFHAAISDGAPIRTDLADSIEDLELIGQIAARFASARSEG